MVAYYIRVSWNDGITVQCHWVLYNLLHTVQYSRCSFLADEMFKERARSVFVQRRVFAFASRSTVRTKKPGPEL